MSTVEMLSAKVYKRKDPRKAIFSVTLLLVLAFGVCLFVPKQWISDTAFFCNLILFSVYGTSVFFFAQERKRWKAVAVVMFAAAAMLEFFMFVRNNCGYDIFLVGRPATSIPTLLSDYAITLNLMRVVFYRLLFLFVMAVFSYMRFTGRKQWWGVVVPASVTGFLCNVVHIIPQVAAPGADSSVVNVLAAQILEHAVFAVMIFITAVLLDWISSFNAKPLYMKTGAVLWTIFGIVFCCGATAFLTDNFLKTQTGAEYIFCAAIAAASFLALLLRKRAGISTAFFAANIAIAISLGLLIKTGEAKHLFISLCCALMPAVTWLVLSNSWQNNAPAKKVPAGSPQTGEAAAKGSAAQPPKAAPNMAALPGGGPASEPADGSGKKDSKKNGKQKRKEKQNKSAKQNDNNTVQIDTAAFESIKSSDAYEAFPNGFCGYCGAVFEADARFCKICGKSRIAVDSAMPVEIAQIHAAGIKSGGQAIRRGATKKIYVETDNRGTMHKDVGQATSYWVMRRPAMQKKPPYLLYVYRDERSARQALLDISYIHVAVDTGNLICDYLMEYGFYEVVNDDETVCYEAVVCGHDLTIERYNEAKASFEKHNGFLKNEQLPDPNYVVPQGIADLNAIILKEEFVDNGRYTYRVHYAPNRATAIEFLRQSRVDQEYLYIVVDTPEGSYGRDIDGMYEV